jgi:hypothetical protein
VHAPTEEKTIRDEKMVDAFYEYLNKAYNEAPVSDVKIILGDFNAKVGRENRFSWTIGNESSHSTFSNNGIKLDLFAASNNIVVRSTFLPQKDIHKGTWRIPNRGPLNSSTNGNSTTNPAAIYIQLVMQIYIQHVLIAGRFFSSITNIRSCRITAHTSDHFLVKVDYKCRLSKLSRASRNKV